VGVGIKTPLVYIFVYELCKILAYSRYESKMHPLPTTITSLFMPLQNVNAIKTLKQLHHKLLVQVVKILTIHCISHLIICPILDDHPQKENIQIVNIFTTKSKCVISEFQNLDFMNDKVENQHSLFTLPKIISIKNSTNAKYLEN
jgi:hypothetical protein